MKSARSPFGWVACCAALLLATEGFAQPGSGPSLVITSTVHEGPLSDLQSFVGTLEPVRQVVVGSAVDGRVRAVHVERGEAVSAAEGEAEVLVELETETLDIEIAASKIQLRLAEEALEELKTSLPIDISLAKAKVAEAQARFDFSQNEFERISKLSRQSNAVSSTELEQASSQFKSDEQLASQANHELERLEATREVRLAQMQSRVAAAVQAVRLLEDQKSKFMIRAPFDGYVVNKLTETGAWVSRGDPVIEVVELKQIDFSVNVPQEHLGKIQQMMGADSKAPIAVTFEGVDEPLTAELMAVLPQVDPRSRLATIRARLDNPMVGGIPILKPGMIGRAHLAVGAERQMTVLSRDALVLGGTTPVVYKIMEQKDRKVVAEIPVTLGNNHGNWVEVVGDVHDGDQVVVLGNERLKPNDEVKVQEVRADRPGGV